MTFYAKQSTESGDFSHKIEGEISRDQVYLKEDFQSEFFLFFLYFFYLTMNLITTALAPAMDRTSNFLHLIYRINTIISCFYSY